MLKKFLSVIMIFSMCLSLMMFGDSISLSANAQDIIVENFDSYEDYTKNIHEISSTKWSYAIQDKSAVSDDTFTVATDGTNQYGLLTSPTHSYSSGANVQDWKLKLNGDTGLNGLVSLSFKIRQTGLSEGINYYIYSTAGNVLRLLVKPNSIIVYPATSKNSWGTQATIETSVPTTGWGTLLVEMNTVIGEISIRAGEGFSTAKNLNISVDCLKNTSVSLLDIRAERAQKNSGTMAIDDVKVSSKNYSIADELSFGNLSTENQGSITKDLTLPSQYTLNNVVYDVTWSSSNISAISNTGKVTRQSFDSVVELTAEFALNGESMGSKVFTCNVLGEGHLVFNDNFTADAGTQITSYNGWTLDTNVPTLQTQSIENDPSDNGNNVLKINRTGNDSLVARVQKLFNPDNVGLNDVVYVSATIRRENTSQPIYMNVADTKRNWIAQTRLEKDGSVKYVTKDNSTPQILAPEGTIPVGKWCNVTIKIDYSDSSFSVFVNGTQASKSGKFYQTVSLETGYVAFSVDRFADTMNDTLYVDNVNVKTQDKDISVKSVFIENSDGIYVKGLENGGKISGAIFNVYKNITEDTYAVAVLYNDGALYDVDLELIDKNNVSSTYTADFDLSLPEEGDLSKFELSIMVWKADTLVPIMDKYTYEEPVGDTVVYIAGDSIAYDYHDYQYPQCGYGEVLGKFFENDIIIDNRAQGGRTSKSFIDEKRLDSISNTITNGDYLFIQFAHNDCMKENQDVGTSVDSSATDTSVSYEAETYEWYLKKYVDVARNAGANPVLIAPIPRALEFTNGYVEDVNLQVYVTAMKNFAKAQNVTLIDLNTGWKNRLKNDGVQSLNDAYKYYMNIAENDERFFTANAVTDEKFEASTYYTVGVLGQSTGDAIQDAKWTLPHTDITHMNVWSAEIAAEIIADEIKESSLTLSEFVNDYKAPQTWDLMAK